MTESTITHRLISTSNGELHAAQTGESNSDCIVFLHGWPEDWTEWQAVLTLAGKAYHTIAFDLPAIGKSKAAAGGEKAVIADTIHEALQKIGCSRYVIVGHDIGAMVAYAYYRRFSPELSGTVLLGAAIPGIAPWKTVLQNPYIWHFAFHAVPELPEKLVSGNQRAYFDYFFDALTHNPAAIDELARKRYAAAYTSASTLRAGFDWYRAFEKDAEANETTTQITTPLLYLRGEFDPGDISEYADGLRAAGNANVETARISGSKHYIPEENPSGLWSEIEAFASKVMR